MKEASGGSCEGVSYGYSLTHLRWHRRNFAGGLLLFLLSGAVVLLLAYAGHEKHGAVSLTGGETQILNFSTRKLLQVTDGLGQQEAGIGMQRLPLKGRKLISRHLHSRGMNGRQSAYQRYFDTREGPHNRNGAGHSYLRVNYLEVE